MTHGAAGVWGGSQHAQHKAAETHTVKGLSDRAPDRHERKPHMHASLSYRLRHSSMAARRKPSAWQVRRGKKKREHVARAAVAQSSPTLASSQPASNHTAAQALFRESRVSGAGDVPRRPIDHVACWVQKVCLYRAHAARFAGVASCCACGQPCHALCPQTCATASKKHAVYYHSD